MEDVAATSTSYYLNMIQVRTPQLGERSENKSSLSLGAAKAVARVTRALVTPEAATGFFFKLEVVTGSGHRPK